MGSIINTDFAGEIGALPRRVKIQTTDSFATITATNYLKGAEFNGYTFYPSDFFDICYGTNSATSQTFTLNISGGNLTLEPSTSDVVLPVVDGNLAVFSGTSGTLDDRGYSPTNAAKTKVVMANGAVAVGNIACFTDTSGTVDDNATIAANGGSIHAGFSNGTGGSLASYSATPNSGALFMTGVANSGNFNVIISNSSHGQSTTYSINDVGQSTGWLMNCTHSTDAGANLISFDITCTAAALASGGSVTLVPSSGSKRYKIRYLYLNAGGTNFSGGGGNRLGVVTDGTTNYAFVTASAMGTLVNAQWGKSGDSDFQASPTTASNTSTVAGQSIVFKYSGGTTDYSTGSLVLSGIVERVV